MSLCEVCQNIKVYSNNQFWLLKLFGPLTGKWTHVKMEFIKPSSGTNNSSSRIFVVVLFVKLIQATSFQINLFAAKVAKRFLENIHKYHMLPFVYVCDRFLVFQNNFWTPLIQRLQTEVISLSAYHPDRWETGIVNSKPKEMVPAYFTYNKFSWASTRNIWSYL